MSPKFLRPKEIVAASKVLSAKGRLRPSPATRGTFRWRPAFNIPREKSHPTTSAPDLDSSAVETPVPAARSTTFSPGFGSSRLRVAFRHSVSIPPVSTVLVRSYFLPTASNMRATSRGFFSNVALATRPQSTRWARYDESCAPRHCGYAYRCSRSARHLSSSVGRISCPIGDSIAAS